MKEEWVRVRSEDELAPGMVVRLDPCLRCGRSETVILAREATGEQISAFGWLYNGAIADAPSRAFFPVPDCDGSDFCAFDGAIREDRLFKLVLREPEATETRARERETVR